MSTALFQDSIFAILCFCWNLESGQEPIWDMDMGHGLRSGSDRMAPARVYGGQLPTERPDDDHPRSLDAVTVINSTRLTNVCCVSPSFPLHVYVHDPHRLAT